MSLIDTTNLKHLIENITIKSPNNEKVITPKLLLDNLKESGDWGRCVWGQCHCYGKAIEIEPTKLLKKIELKEYITPEDLISLPKDVYESNDWGRCVWGQCHCYGV